MKTIILLILLFTEILFAQPLQIILNWKPEPEFGGFYSAQINGYYKKYNLDVKIVEGGSGTPTPQLLANEKTEFAIVSGDEILVANERNSSQKLVPLFAVYQTAPYMIMTHPEKGYKSLTDFFSSKDTLAIQSGMPFYLFLKNKYPHSLVQVVPYTGGVATFLSNKDFAQQGFITSEPLLVKKSGSDSKCFLISDEGFNPYTTVLAARKSYVDTHKSEVQKILKAVTDGWKSYLKDPKSTNQYMSQLNPAMDINSMQESAQAQKVLIENADTKNYGLGSMRTSRWQELHKQLLEIKLISNNNYDLEVWNEKN